MSLRLTKLPRPLYLASSVQQLDKIAIDTYGMGGFDLMQRVGMATFNALLEQWPQTRAVRVFAGSGNNAGDGYIVAGLASSHGLQAEVIYVEAPDKLKGDARKAWQWACDKQVTLGSLDDFLADTGSRHSGELATRTVVVDALFGTGLSRAVSGRFAQAINHINAGDHAVVAIDIPSGLSADTGCALGVTVNANLTVTFIGLKPGMLTGNGREFVGEIIFHDLDIPESVYTHSQAPSPVAHRIDINDATRHLPPRHLASHKGQHGHVVVVGGDYTCGGAVLLAAEAALRTGAGLVSVVTRSAHRPAILAHRPELMVMGTEDHGAVDAAPTRELLNSLLARASVLVVGPGLGTTQFARSLIQAVFAAQIASNTPLVIDADGLRLLAEKSAHSTGTRRCNYILTPHPGEAAQLLDCTVEAVQSDRLAAVRALQSKWGGHCLLKGSGSLLCSVEAGQQTVYLSSEGNPGMATAGMGDVLSGIIASLVAQGLTLADSLKCAVVIHGEAADLAAGRAGARGMLATDIFPFIRQLVNPVQSE